MTDNAETTTQSATNGVATTASVWDDVKKVKDLCFPKQTMNEFEILLKFGKKLNADPFLGEIFFIQNRPFLSRDYYRKTAQSQPNYAGHNTIAFYENDVFSFKTGEINHDFTFKNRGKLLGAYCVVYVKGIAKPYVEIVMLSECQLSTPVWQKSPQMMVCKVAEARGLRLAFNVFQGTYSVDERWDITDKQAPNETAQPTATIKPQQTISQPEPMPIEAADIKTVIEFILQTNSEIELKKYWESLSTEMKNQEVVQMAKNQRKQELQHPATEALPSQDEFVMDDEYKFCENELLSDLKKAKTEADWEDILQRHYDNAPFLKNEGTAKKVNELKHKTKLK